MRDYHRSSRSLVIVESVNEDVVLALVVSEVMDTLLADADACADPPERSLCSSAERQQKQTLLEEL